MQPIDVPEAWLERLLTPALVVDLARVRRNVARVVEVLGGRADRWRPHVKTTKMPIVWEVLLEAGVRRFKCATTREAGLLLDTLERAGVAGDVLLAQPLVGPSLARLADLARRAPGQRVSVLCEDEAAAQGAPPELGVFVDLNPGMDRTGLGPDRDDQVARVLRAAGARLRGVHCYDGHLCMADPDERRRAVQDGLARLAERVAAWAADGLDLPEVVTAGTPAFACAAEGSPLAGHTLSPGTVVFHDARSAEQNPGLPLEPAAVVLARVLSHPAPGRATCDAGSKSLAAEAGDPCAEVLGWPGLVARTPSEEHLPLDAVSGPRPERGALLQLVPRHVCPTVNLADEALVVDGERVRVERVAARGHELLRCP